MGVCIISTSTESLSHLPFLDHHHPHILRESGETMEDVCTANRKNAATTEFPTTETSCSNLHKTALQEELANVDSINTSYKHLILTATQLLRW